MRPIKICQMIDQAFLGGGQKNVLAIAEGLDRSLFEVTVCSRPDGLLPAELERRGIPHFPVHFRKRLSLRLISQIRGFLQEGGSRSSFPRARPHVPWDPLSPLSETDSQGGVHPSRQEALAPHRRCDLRIGFCAESEPRPPPRPGG